MGPWESTPSRIQTDVYLPNREMPVKDVMLSQCRQAGSFRT